MYMVRATVIGTFLTSLGLVLGTCAGWGPSPTPTWSPAVTLFPTASSLPSTTVSPKVSVTPFPFPTAWLVPPLLPSPQATATAPVDCLLVSGSSAGNFEPGTLEYDIWVVDLRAGTSRPWLPDGQRKVCPLVSPDKKHVAYIVYAAGGQSVWVANPDGSVPERWSPVYPYTRTLKLGLFLIGWSSDGQLLGYGLSENNLPEMDRFYVLDAITHQVREVSGQRVRWIRGWLPGPGYRLLIRDQEGQFGFLDIDTGAIHRVNLPPLPSGCQVRDLSPDVQSILLMCDETTREMVVVGIDGQHAQSLGQDVWEVLWSPDGQYIVYEASSPYHRSFDLYVMDRRGSYRRRVIEKCVFSITNSNGTGYPWSPDRQWLSVLKLGTSNDNHEELYVVHLGTGAVYQVPLGVQNLTDLSWDWLSQE